MAAALSRQHSQQCLQTARTGPRRAPDVAACQACHRRHSAVQSSAGHATFLWPGSSAALPCALALPAQLLRSAARCAAAPTSKSRLLWRSCFLLPWCARVLNACNDLSTTQASSRACLRAAACVALAERSGDGPRARAWHPSQQKDGNLSAVEDPALRSTLCILQVQVWGKRSRQTATLTWTVAPYVLFTLSITT